MTPPEIQAAAQQVIREIVAARDPLEHRPDRLRITCGAISRRDWIVIQESRSKKFFRSEKALLERRFDFFLVARDQLVLCDHARAGVPTEQRIVVSRRANRFRFLKLPHRFAQTVMRIMAGPRSALGKFRLSAPLGEDP